MNIRELKEMIEEYPDDMEILNGRYSDYAIISADEWSLVKGVENKSGWVMKSHPTMSEENKNKEKMYLYLCGN